MAYKFAVLGALLIAIFLSVPIPSEGFGIFKGGGGGGGSNVAEILAAGLITGLLMDSRPVSARPMFQQLRHNIMGGYGMMPPRHAMYHPMVHARVPVMRPYRPPVMNRPRYVMKQAMMRQASHEALTARLNEEIRALKAQESVLEAYLASSQQASDPALAQLLAEEDTIPAAALLLQTSDLMPSAMDFEKAHALAPPGLLPAGSEPESRYLLPRIVKHFVQRLMRRGQHP